MRKFTILLSAFLFSCSTKPKIKPRNEINEPVFYPMNHASIGAPVGVAAGQDEIRRKLDKSFYVVPFLSYDVNVSDWASYSLLPVYWKFLLTGQQYENGSNLKIGKLHSAFYGGIAGIAYSQLDGLTTSFSCGAAAKYLFDGKLFNETNLFYDMYNTKKPGYYVFTLGNKQGLQITDKNSLSLSYEQSYFHIPKFRASNRYGVYYLDGDNNSELFLSHHFYWNPKNILGPEAGFGFKNFDLKSGFYFRFGFHYAYVFD